MKVGLSSNEKGRDGAARILYKFGRVTDAVWEVPMGSGHRRETISDAVPIATVEAVSRKIDHEARNDEEGLPHRSIC